MKSEDEKATRWRDYYAEKARTSFDKPYYKKKEAEWVYKLRFIRLSAIGC